jgi:hypothetical protein
MRLYLLVFLLLFSVSSAKRPYYPEIKLTQLLLQKSGFNPGGIDGKYGPKTEAAIKKFIAKSNKAFNLKLKNYHGKPTPLLEYLKSSDPKLYNESVKLVGRMPLKERIHIGKQLISLEPLGEQILKKVFLKKKPNVIFEIISYLSSSNNATSEWAWSKIAILMLNKRLINHHKKNDSKTFFWLLEHHGALTVHLTTSKEIEEASKKYEKLLKDVSKRYKIKQ